MFKKKKKKTYLVFEILFSRRAKVLLSTDRTFRQTTKKEWDFHRRETFTFTKPNGADFFNSDDKCHIGSPKQNSFHQKQSAFQWQQQQRVAWFLGRKINLSANPVAATQAAESNFQDRWESIPLLVQRRQSVFHQVGLTVESPVGYRRHGDAALEHGTLRQEQQGGEETSVGLEVKQHFTNPVDI